MRKQHRNTVGNMCKSMKTYKNTGKTCRNKRSNKTFEICVKIKKTQNIPPPKKKGTKRKYV